MPKLPICSPRERSAFASFAAWDPKGRMFLANDTAGNLLFYRRIRPEQWYGIFWLKEMWATLLFSITLLWSLHRDWKGLARGGRREESAA